MKKELFFTIIFLQYIYDLYSDVEEIKGLGLSFTPENIIDIAKQCGVNEALINKFKEWVNCEADRENIKLSSDKIEELANKGIETFMFFEKIVENYWHKNDINTIRKLNHIN